MFKWTEECAAAFKSLSRPILAFPDYSRELILDTDASDTVIGCVLSRIHEDGAEHVTAYGSRSQKEIIDASYWRLCTSSSTSGPIY